jgi:hypothetical protein
VPRFRTSVFTLTPRRWCLFGPFSRSLRRFSRRNSARYFTNLRAASSPARCLSQCVNVSSSNRCRQQCSACETSLLPHLDVNRPPLASGFFLEVPWSMVGIAGLGPADRQTVEHAVRDRRGRAQACRYPAQDVGQRNRLSRRLRRQGHATIAIEACTVIAAGARKINAGVAPSMLRRS